MGKIEIQVLFFGSLKQFYGSTCQLSVDEGTSIQQMTLMLMALKPEADKVFESCMFAVNSDLVDRDFLIKENSELAILPPYSGG